MRPLRKRYIVRVVLEEIVEEENKLDSAVTVTGVEVGLTVHALEIYRHPYGEDAVKKQFAATMAAIEHHLVPVFVKHARSSL